LSKFAATRPWGVKKPEHPILWSGGRRFDFYKKILYNIYTR
jgi:hypothetical protein